jgi:SAM-dependent methyltransferase
VHLTAQMSLALQCPRCIVPLRDSSADTKYSASVCPVCKSSFPCIDGIWRCLTSDRVAHYAPFIADYESIRAAEGRGSGDDAYYLALPWKDRSGANRQQWSIRSKTFRYIERHILSAIASRHEDPLRVLDLGAGNGWLSYRLARMGHTPIAVDLLTNDRDGLGAASHYGGEISPLFHRVQAELDHLPFADGTFDLIIFNASFHYSVNYLNTLREALRCTSPGGTILIADTPWYLHEHSGHQMVEERKAYFRQRYGFPSDSIPSLEFLTDERIDNLRSSLKLDLTVHRPFYGIRWALRPFFAKLQKKRSPSRFYIYRAQASQ